MHLLLLTDGLYPFQVGGMQKHSYYLAEYLACQQVKITLVHIGGKADAAFSEKARPWIQEKVIPFPSSFRFPGHYLYNSYRHGKRIAHAVKSQAGVDFIYAQGYTAWHLLNLKQKGESLPPICVNFHGMEAFQPAASFRNIFELFIMAQPMKKQILQSDYVQSLGGRLTDLLLDLGKSHDSILQIPIGLDAEWLVDKPTPVNSIRKFVFLGRYTRRKGVEELNKVLTKLAERESFRMEFIGPIPNDKRLKGESFVYHGLVRDAAKIQSILRDADVLVVPSHSEGMPTVILEAMASGCAVIATDVGAVCEEVDKKVGWLIPPRNEKELERAMREALHISDQALTELQNQAIEKVKRNFLWPSVATVTLNQIQSIISFKDQQSTL